MVWVLVKLPAGGVAGEVGDGGGGYVGHGHVADDREGRAAGARAGAEDPDGERVAGAAQHQRRGRPGGRRSVQSEVPGAAQIHRPAGETGDRHGLVARAQRVGDRERRGRRDRAGKQLLAPLRRQLVARLGQAERVRQGSCSRPRCCAGGGSRPAPAWHRRPVQLQRSSHGSPQHPGCRWPPAVRS